MKRLTGILISLLTLFTTLCGVFAADSPAAATAYIEDSRLVIDYSENMADTAVIAYYNGQTLCGAYISETDGRTYTFGIAEGYTKIRVWFSNEDEMRTVHIIDRSSLAAQATNPPSPAPSALPTAEPADSSAENPSEEYDEGYGGFLVPPERATLAPDVPDEPSDDENENVQTFTFSVECHNALSSDSLNEELRAVLPPDGFIAPTESYKLTDGMTVYDALTEAADKYGFDVKTKSGYISAIWNLGEFDCGPFSGWMYLVNGEAIMSPMDGYVIVDGDVVQVAYTCLLGNDLGQEVE